MPYEELTPVELARKRGDLVTEISRIEQELNRRRAADRHLMKASDVKWSDIKDTMGLHTKRSLKTASLVNPELGFNIHNFHVFLAELGPECTEGAYHKHGEAVKYYLEGEGIELVGDKRYEVKAGDAVFIPADTWHGTQNPGSKPLKFLAAAQSSMFAPIAKWPIFELRKDLTK